MASWEILRDPEISWETPWDPQNSWEIPRDPKTSRETPRDPESSWDFPRDPAGPRDFLRDPVTSWENLRDPERLREILRLPERSRETLTFLRPPKRSRERAWHLSDRGWQRGVVSHGGGGWEISIWTRLQPYANSVDIGSFDIEKKVGKREACFGIHFFIRLFVSHQSFFYLFSSNHSFIDLMLSFFCQNIFSLPSLVSFCCYRYHYHRYCYYSYYY